MLDLINYLKKSLSKLSGGTDMNLKKILSVSLGIAGLASLVSCTGLNYFEKKCLNETRQEYIDVGNGFLCHPFDSYGVIMAPEHSIGIQGGTTMFVEALLYKDNTGQLVAAKGTSPDFQDFDRNNLNWSKFCNLEGIDEACLKCGIIKYNRHLE